MTEKTLEKITLPRTSDNTDESLVVFWYKSVGEQVEQGEPLVEVQTDKASFDIEAPSQGVLKEICVERGDSAQVGDVLAILSQENDAPILRNDDPVQELEVQGNEGTKKLPPVSPRVRHLAKQMGINLEDVVGTGPNGKITEADLKKAATQQNDGKVERTSEDRTLGTFAVRRTIARRMLDSLQQSAQLTETAWADVTVLSSKRKTWCEEASWNDWVLRAVTLALLEHPTLNATWRETEIERHPHVHLGIATDTEKGLLVPVVKEAEGLNMQDLHKAVKEVVEKAKTGQATGEQLSGSTFTVTNLGGYGIQFFTPIINPPEAAILGVGKIETQVILNEGELENHERLPLSLTFDHCVVDGAPAARFLKTIISYLENPETLLN